MSTALAMGQMFGTSLAKSAIRTIVAIVRMVVRAQVPYMAFAEYPPCHKLRSTEDCLFSSILADAAFMNVSRADGWLSGWLLGFDMDLLFSSES